MTETAAGPFGGESDLLVVGAGPAGSTAAAVAARAGLRVLLVDAAEFPRDKACGEGIMPGGVALLERFGLGDALGEAEAQPFRTIRFHFDAEAPVTLPMDGGAGQQGMAVSRLRLDAALLDHAARAGATAIAGARLDHLESGAEGVLATITWQNRVLVHRARTVLVATGLPAPAARAPRFGITGHVPDDGPSGSVDVFVRPGLEVYSSAVGGGERVVALLVDARHAGTTPGDLRSRFSALLQDPSLPGWLRIAPTRVLGAPLFLDPLLRPLCCHDTTGRILRAGNALVPTDPVAAQGMTIALRSGGEAAEAVVHGMETGASPLATAGRYRVAVTPWIRRSRIIARSLREVVEIPRLGRWILGRIAAQGPGSALVNDAASTTLPRSPARTLGSIALAALHAPGPAANSR